jgi:hypothetical protein
MVTGALGSRVQQLNKTVDFLKEYAGKQKKRIAPPL